MNNDWDLGAVVRRWFNRKPRSQPLVNFSDPNQGDTSSSSHHNIQPTVLQCHNPFYENLTRTSSLAFDSTQVTPTFISQNNDVSTSQQVSCMQEWRSVHTRKNREMITQEHETVSLTDGFVWKKYGQRVVKGSVHPRDYYKCNSGHACPAKRHVDTITVDPPKYVVAYYGFHNHPIP